MFRLVYISSVDLNSNITGTMPTTVFLFILEPNLAILCVSIPMLRPFYILYKKRVGGSRLDEGDSRPTGFRDEPSSSAFSAGHHQRSGGGSRGPGKGLTAGNISTWEMDEYYPPGKEPRHDAMVTSGGGGGDESGSEKNLTYAPSSAPREEIRVQTQWTVDRK